MRTYLVETKLPWKPVQTTAKKLFKFTKKNHTCRWYDDTQSYKIFCPNSISFVIYKNNKFLTNHLDSFLAWNLLFLYLTNEINLDKIFYKIVYHHIIYMCDFFCEFRWLFYRGLHGFSPDMFPVLIGYL